MDHPSAKQICGVLWVCVCIVDCRHQTIFMRTKAIRFDKYSIGSQVLLFVDTKKCLKIHCFPQFLLLEIFQKLPLLSSIPVQYRSRIALSVSGVHIFICSSSRCLIVCFRGQKETSANTQHCQRYQIIVVTFFLNWTKRHINSFSFYIHKFLHIPFVLPFAPIRKPTVLLLPASYKHRSWCSPAFWSGRSRAYMLNKLKETYESLWRGNLNFEK